MSEDDLSLAKVSGRPLEVSAFGQEEEEGEKMKSGRCVCRTPVNLPPAVLVTPPSTLLLHTLEHLSPTEQKRMAHRFSAPGSINMEHLQAFQDGTARSSRTAGTGG